MPIAPLITFKAGECQLDFESTPGKVTPVDSPGYLYLYSEDELVHFCWRKRDQPIDDPSLDLVMVPTDGTFVPYEFEKGSKPSAKTNGRIFVLKFASSSQRHLFWLQSKPQGRSSDPSFFSPRDRKIGDVVNRILQGEEVNVTRELAAVRNTDSRRDDDDDDEQMEDADSRPAPRARHGSTGGAGADATGGDVREEGEDSREGGADGARAASGTDADSAVRNFLASLQGQGLPARGQQADVPYPYLNHLLPTSITVPMVDTASPKYIDTLLDSLPGSIVMLAATGELEDGNSEPKPSEVAEAKKGLSIERKRALIKKVLRSPQFSQGLGTLTMALRDGGLPSIADALDIEIENGGYIRQGGMPMGGGQAIQTFVEGVKQTVKEELEDEDK